MVRYINEEYKGRIMGYMQNGEFVDLWLRDKNSKIIEGQQLFELLIKYESLSEIEDKMQLMYDTFFGYRPCFFETRNFVFNSTEYKIGIDVNNNIIASRVGNFIVEKERDKLYKSLVEDIAGRISECASAVEKRVLIEKELEYIQDVVEEKKDIPFFSKGFNQYARRKRVEFEAPLDIWKCYAAGSGASFMKLQLDLLRGDNLTATLENKAIAETGKNKKNKTEANKTLKDIWINDNPSHFDAVIEALKENNPTFNKACIIENGSGLTWVASKSHARAFIWVCRTRNFINPRTSALDIIRVMNSTFPGIDVSENSQSEWTSTTRPNLEYVEEFDLILPG